MDQIIKTNESINMNKVKLKWIKTLIDLEIDYYKEYISDSNQLVFEKKQALEKYVTDLHNSNPTQHDNYIQSCEDEYKMYELKYTKIISNQNLVSAYSLLESFLKDIILIIAPTQNINHFNTERYNDEIIKISKIDRSSIEHLWDLIIKHKGLRNVIVHHNSNIIEKPTKNIESQPKYKSIEILKTITIESAIYLDKETGSIYIQNNKLVINFLNYVKEYLTKLIDLLNNTHK